MNAEKMTNRITIQKLTTTINANGYKVETWSDFKTVWASKSNLSGREYWGAKAVQQENTVEFGTRYAAFVDEMDSKSYRIVHDLKIYNINFIDNIGYNRTFVKFKTLELVA